MAAAECDLVIVGGGFAGLAAARAAALRGLAVRVLEAKPAIGARLHTTGILVKEAIDALDPPAALIRRVAKVRLYGPSRRSVDLAAPGYYFATTDTAALLAWMAGEAARVGVAIECGARFEGAAREDGAIVLRRSGESLRARYLLGADGARSEVAAAFGLGRNRHFIGGVEREFPVSDGLDPAFLHVIVDGRLAPGYIAWAAAAPSVAQIGLAAGPGRRARIDAFLAEAAGRFGIDPAAEVERRAGLIPCGGLVRPFAAPGVLLVGDAAGMVSPLTGGGIHPALALGRRAGQLIADHLLAGAPAPELVLRPELPRYGLKRLARRAFDLGVPNFLAEAVLMSAAARHLARRTFFARGGAREAAATPAPQAKAVPLPGRET